MVESVVLRLCAEYESTYPGADSIGNFRDLKLKAPWHFRIYTTSSKCPEASGLCPYSKLILRDDDSRSYLPALAGLWRFAKRYPEY